MKKFALLAALSAGTALLTSIAPAVTLFDASGFEGYATGNLTGQNTWTQDSGTAGQFTVIDNGGTIGKLVQGNGGATAWNFPAIPGAPFTPAAGEQLVIEASLARNVGATAATTSFGYSIDVYSPAARTTRFGLGTDGTSIFGYVTARFNTVTSQFDPTAAVTNVRFSNALAADTLFDFRAVMDYGTKTMDLFFGGTSVTGGSTIPFADLTATALLDADFQVSSVAGATDRGFMDNYRVSTASPVPEPATMAILGVGAAALLRRRRKSA